MPIFQSRAPTSNPSEDQIEIDEGAYYLMKDYLNEIEVLVEPESVTEGKYTDLSIYTRLITLSEQSPETADEGKGKGKGKVIETPQSPAPSNTSHETVSMPENLPQTKANPSVVSRSSETLSSSSAQPSSSSTFKPASPGPSYRTELADPHDLFNEGIPVESASPKKAASSSSKDKISAKVRRHVDVNTPPTPPLEPKVKRPIALNHESDEWEELPPMRKFKNDVTGCE